MPVASADSVAVIDHNRLPVAAHNVRERHNAIGGSDNRSTVAASDIYAAMECAFSVERVDALAEASGDLAFDRPKIGSGIGLCPISSGGVPRQAHGQAHH